jgi:uncharacterized protein (TIGR03083 family)
LLAAAPLRPILFIIQNGHWYHPRPLRLPRADDPWQSTGMDDSRFLDCLAADYAALRQAAAAAELTTPVPSCPGWTMADLVAHVGVTYLHKVVIMRTGEWPNDWPPPATAQEPPLALLDRGYAELTAEFAARNPADPTPTWYEPDETVAFWIRRMAQETAIHRIDAELAAAIPVTRVPDDLAVDGADEVLKRMLAYGSVAWPEDFAEMKVEHLAAADAKDTIAVVTQGATWTVRPSPREVTVTDGAPDNPRALIGAAPDPLLRWLWGRAPQDAVQVTGDPAWASYLREMIAAVTV